MSKIFYWCIKLQNERKDISIIIPYQSKVNCENRFCNKKVVLHSSSFRILTFYVRENNIYTWLKTTSLLSWWRSFEKKLKEWYKLHRNMSSQIIRRIHLNFESWRIAKRYDYERFSAVVDDRGNVIRQRSRLVRDETFSVIEFAKISKQIRLIIGLDRSSCGE